MITSLKETIAGDIILTASPEWLSKVIRMFESWQTGEANRSHAALAIGDYRCYEPLTEDRINWLDKYEGQDAEVWRLPLKELDRQRLSISVPTFAGTNYGYSKIALFALDSVATLVKRKLSFGKPVEPVSFFSKDVGFLPTWVCSTGVIMRIYENSKYRILDENHKESDPRTLSPDRIQDLLEHPHNGAKLIFKGSISPCGKTACPQSAA